MTAHAVQERKHNKVPMMETLIRILDWPMKRPELYGWYHLLWWVIPLVAVWVLCRCWKNSRDPERFCRRVVFGTAVVVAVFEVLHQFNYNVVWEDGAVQLDPMWYAFPFQFCSTPMYAGLLTGLFRKGRIHDALCAYLATYAVFAGLCVMIYPAEVYTRTILTNVQTMVCHSSMLTIGIFLFYTGHVKREHRTILRAAPVFAVCVGVAALLNEIAYWTGLLEEHTFNMFFISPHCEPSLPVYSLVQAVVPYPWCLMIYVLVFSLAAYVILLLAMGIERLWARKRASEAK